MERTAHRPAAQPVDPSALEGDGARWAVPSDRAQAACDRSRWWRCDCARRSDMPSLRTSSTTARTPRSPWVDDAEPALAHEQLDMLRAHLAESLPRVGGSSQPSM